MRIFVSLCLSLSLSLSLSAGVCSLACMLGSQQLLFLSRMSRGEASAFDPPLAVSVPSFHLLYDPPLSSPLSLSPLSRS